MRTLAKVGLACAGLPALASLGAALPRVEEVERWSLDDVPPPLQAAPH